MTGSILFAGVCAIIYFIVGIRFSNELMADGLTSLGEFAVLGLIILFSALLVKAYCKNSDRAVVYILSFGLGSMLLGWLFSLYVIPFDVVYLQGGVCVALCIYLVYLFLHERIRNYLYILVFTIGSVGFLFLPIMCSMKYWNLTSRFV